MTKLRTLAAAAVFVSIEAPAYAYLDGATASMLLQGVIGFFAAWALYSRRAIDWVKRLARRTARNAD
jgi:hypothetical protein